MKRLTFLIHPPTLKTGSDSVSLRAVEEMRKHGVDARIYSLWPDSLAKILKPQKSWAGRQLYKRLVSPLSILRFHNKFNNEDIVWMYDISQYNCPEDYRLESTIVKKGGKLVFQFHDAWVYTSYKEAGLARIRIASMVAGLTQGIVDSIVPFTSENVELLRGPIDVYRLEPVNKQSEFSTPRVVWTGNLHNLQEIPNVGDILRSVYDKCRFNFIVVSGSSKPEVDIPIPWTWFPYSETEESLRISGACVGLAPLPDTQYAQCKDVYKVKTYMACGVPPITSRIGNNLSVVKDGETGFLVNSAEEWESRLLELVSNPGKAEIMGRAAREDCVKRFSHEAIIPEWIEVLERHFGPIRKGVAE